MAETTNLEEAIAQANALAARGREEGWDNIPADKIHEALSRLRTARNAVSTRAKKTSAPTRPADLGAIFGGGGRGNA